MTKIEQYEPVEFLRMCDCAQADGFESVAEWILALANRRVEALHLGNPFRELPVSVAPRLIQWIVD